MAAGFLHLLGLCVAMFAGAFTAGYIPVLLSSVACLRSRMVYINSLGVGMLIGTAFIVVIPEVTHPPVDTHFATTPSVSPTSPPPLTPPSTTTLLPPPPPLPSSSPASPSPATANDEHTHTDDLRPQQQPPSPSPSPPPASRRLSADPHHRHEQGVDHPHTLPQPPLLQAAVETRPHTHAAGDDHDHDLPSPTFPSPTSPSSPALILHTHTPADCTAASWAQHHIGLALAMGFLMMLLLDRVFGGHGHVEEASAGGGGGGAHGHSHGGGHGHSHAGGAVAAGGGGEDKHHSSAELSDQLLGDESPVTSPLLPSTVVAITPQQLTIAPQLTVDRPSPVTLGLLVHCAVDGLALGAISVAKAAAAGGGGGGEEEGSSGLEWVVFLAIILHKVPNAFGLTTFLLQARYSLPAVRRQLTIFCLAAPCSALLTYIVVGHLVVLDSGWLGLLLLFSGGTFLYTIAAHVLPELEAEPTPTAATGREGHSRQVKGRSCAKWLNIFCIALGTVLPAFITIEHDHSH